MLCGYLTRARNHVKPVVYGFFIACVSVLIVAGSAGAQSHDGPGNVVKIIGTKGSWQLTVNGENFRVKGVTVGHAVGRDGVDYLKMAQELGANTVRTWGADQGDRNYLNTAAEYGLKVNAGIWLNPVLEDSTHSYLDPVYLAKTREEVLKYIRDFKDHPAILSWNIGNEAISKTVKEEERAALGEFLESLIREVHATDPNHPVVYSSSSTNDIHYLKRHVPSLDIVGINAYGGIDEIHQSLTALFDIPYMLTEFRSISHWERSKDANGLAFEWADESKMSYYKQLAHKIKSYEGHCLGGFVHNLGDTTQVSLTWWNINHGNLKKYSFWAMEDFYKGQDYRKPPFVVKDLALSRTNVQPLEEIGVAVELKNVADLAAPVDYEYVVSSSSENVRIEYPNERIPMEVLGNGPSVTIRAPSKPGTYRIYVVASSGDYASTFNKSVRVVE